MPQLQSGIASRALLTASVVTALLHLSLLLLLPHPKVASNLLQEFSVLLAITLCFHQRHQSPNRYNRQLWLQLATAFSIWAFAQSLYIKDLLTSRVNIENSLSNAVLLIFAFPLLMVASRSRRNQRRDLAAWMDTAQAAIFLTVLFVLVFLPPATLSARVAYNFQSFATVLICALRYSTTQIEPERLFFRNLLLYSVLYGLCSTIGFIAPSSLYGFRTGSLFDLCWTLPFLIFIAVVLTSKTNQKNSPDRRYSVFPGHLQGISAVSLAVMSLVASGILANHRAIMGGCFVAIAFLLFAVRTSAREWQLRMAQARLQHTAFHDPLTGLANRTLLQQELMRCLSIESAVPGKQTAVLFLDLDRFKVINDGLGHMVGDRLLVDIATRLNAAVRPGDIVARHGGDEFIILLSEVTLEQAEEIAARVIAAVRQPLDLDGELIYTTGSVGLALASPGANADEVLRNADSAMYKAKARGKDHTEIFTSNMEIPANRKLRLETDLRRAILADTVEVYYQPICTVKNTHVVGFEALARWTHPVFGAISPGEFIPLAEEMGLIAALGRHVLRQACSHTVSWNQRFDGSLFISVNVSPHQFDDSGLLLSIERVLFETGLSPHLLKLEITESVLLSGHPSVERTLEQARTLGTQMCLDDFGTGYSSLSYLLHYPFDVIKIDQSFVRNLDHDDARVELVRTVVELAGRLGKRVVAEGVESSQELEKLLELGCHMAQGFFFSKPLPAHHTETLLRAFHEQVLPQHSVSHNTALLLPRFSSFSPLFVP